MKHSGNRQGFSLIEMLTVIALLSVVTTMGVGMFFKVTDSWAVSRNYTALSRSSEAIFASLQRDVSRVVSQQLSGVGVRGVTGSMQDEDPESLYFRTTLEDDSLVLPVMEEDPVTGRSQLINVTYHIDRSGPVPVLARVLGEFGTDAMGARAGQWAGIWGLRVEFFDEGAWQGAWDATHLPEAIRVSITLASSEYPADQIARSATFTIHVD